MQAEVSLIRNREAKLLRGFIRIAELEGTVPSDPIKSPLSSSGD